MPTSISDCSLKISLMPKLGSKAGLFWTVGTHFPLKAKGQKQNIVKHKINSFFTLLSCASHLPVSSSTETTGRWVARSPGVLLAPASARKMARDTRWPAQALWGSSSESRKKGAVCYNAFLFFFFWFSRPNLVDQIFQINRRQREYSFAHAELRASINICIHDGGAWKCRRDGSLLCGMWTVKADWAVQALP